MMKKTILKVILIVILFGCQTKENEYLESTYYAYRKRFGDEIYISKNEYINLMDFQEAHLKFNHNTNYFYFLLNGIVGNDKSRKLISENKMHYKIWDYKKYQNISYQLLKFKMENELGNVLYIDSFIDLSEDYPGYSKKVHYYLSKNSNYIFEVYFVLPTTKINTNSDILFYEFDYLVLKYEINSYKNYLEELKEEIEEDFNTVDTKSQELLELIEKYGNSEE